jgi:hypothetical protein
MSIANCLSTLALSRGNLPQPCSISEPSLSYLCLSCFRRYHWWELNMAVEDSLQVRLPSTPESHRISLI